MVAAPAPTPARPPRPGPATGGLISVPSGVDAVSGPTCVHGDFTNAPRYQHAMAIIVSMSIDVS
eukprot:3157803-Pyramimonas_sp.AAC.1